MGWQIRLAFSPWWVVALVQGGGFGAFITVSTGLRRGDWVTAAVTGLIGGVVFGLVLGPATARRNRRTLHDLGAPAESVRAALRGGRRGRIPADETVRAAVLTWSRRRHERSLHDRPGLAVVGSILVVACGGLAVTRAPWWWLPAVLSALLVGEAWWAPRRLEHRIAAWERDNH